MSKWLVLPMAALLSLAATASGVAPRDRDHDRLPDRWERKHHLSTRVPSARRDPDRDGVTNRREFRLRTHPRRADTDRDGLRDGAEVRRHRTNPRRRDTDRDGYSDGVEVRAGTNPRDPRSHPRQGGSTSPAPTPAGFPDASNTGVPAGTTLTGSGPLIVTQAGAVVDGKNIPYVVVNAPNVTIRNSRIHGGEFWLVDNNSTGLVIEDSELDGEGNNNIAVGSESFTLRRVEMTGTENGMDIGAGDVTVEDSYIHDLTTTGGAHTDGAQLGQGAHDIVFRHNTISPQDSGAAASTSAIIMWTEGGAQNARVRIENNLLDGSHAAFALYAPRQPASSIYINNNRFNRGQYGYTDCVNGPSTVTEFGGNVDHVTGAPVRADG